jgi:hypothetical protein
LLLRGIRLESGGEGDARILRELLLGFLKKSRIFESAKCGEEAACVASVFSEVGVNLFPRKFGSVTALEEHGNEIRALSPLARRMAAEKTRST